MRSIYSVKGYCTNLLEERLPVVDEGAGDVHCCLFLLPDGEKYIRGSQICKDTHIYKEDIYIESKST